MKRAIEFNKGFAINSYTKNVTGDAFPIDSMPEGWIDIEFDYIDFSIYVWGASAAGLCTVKMYLNTGMPATQRYLGMVSCVVPADGSYATMEKTLPATRIGQRYTPQLYWTTGVNNSIGGYVTVRGRVIVDEGFQQNEWPENKESCNMIQKIIGSC